MDAALRKVFYGQVEKMRPVYALLRLQARATVKMIRDVRKGDTK